MDNGGKNCARNSSGALFIVDCGAKVACGDPGAGGAERLAAGWARRTGCRRALTLLELLLALALTTLILGVISMAIQLNLRALDTRRSDVEQAQLAQAVLETIARDLRAAIRSNPVDFSSLAEGAADAGAEALDQMDGLDELLGEGEQDAMQEEAQGIADSLAPSSAMGLVGDQYELEVDVSRLPRVEEYQQFVDPEDPDALSDIPSDVKTVAYYLLPPGMASPGESAGLGSLGAQTDKWGEDLSQGGLVRRELDRAVAKWAADSGRLDELDRNLELVAPEVTTLEFQYFDGVEWLTEWDSEEQEGLPVAVEIVISLRSPGGDTQSVGAAAPGIGADESAAGDQYYRLVVRLPAATPAAEQTQDLETLGL